MVRTDSYETTQKLLKELQAHGFDAESPADSDRHIYYNWDTVMQKRGAHHPLMDPYKMEANRSCKMDYTRETLPETNDILKSTVMIRSNLDWLEKGILEEKAQLLGQLISSGNKSG